MARGSISHIALTVSDLERAMSAALLELSSGDIVS